MRKFHSIAALCGDGLRPELQALFDQLAIDPHSELFVRRNGMIQAGPDPKHDTEIQNGHSQNQPSCLRSLPIFRSHGRTLRKPKGARRVP
jgi:hypothetical protein